jgi:iron(III) transport system permease protein
MQKKPKIFSSKRWASSERGLTVPGTTRLFPWTRAASQNVAVQMRLSVFQRIREQSNPLFQIHNCLFIVLTVGLFALVVGPLLVLVVNSFRQVTAGDLGFALTNLGLQNYVEAYANPKTYTMLLNSVWFAGGSTLLALLMGGLLAFLAERTDFRYRNYVYAIVVIPMITPGIVKAAAWVFLLSPRIGLINQLADQIGLGASTFNGYSVAGMIWAEAISFTPLAFFLIASTLKTMDSSLEEAAIASGASPMKAFRSVTVPLIAPGIAGAGMLLFINGMEALEIPLLMGLSKGIFLFSTNIYYSVHVAFPPNYGLGFAFSVTLTLITLLSLYLYQREFAHSERYAVVSGKGYRPALFRLGRWSCLVYLFLGFFLLVGFVLPFLVLLWTSLLPFYQPLSSHAFASLSLTHYYDGISSRRFYEVIINTFAVGALATVSMMLLALCVSWVLYRTEIRGRRILDLLAFLPRAIPSLAVAVALMIVFLSFKNPVYNSLWILIIGYTIAYLPVATRFTHAAVMQVHKELEEAAYVSGAGFWKGLASILIPLVQPSLLNGGLVVFVLTMKVMSIAAILSGTDNMLLSVYIWALWENGSTGEASAVSVLMVILVGLLTYLGRRLQGTLAGQGARIE